MPSSFRLGKIAGIEIGAHWSWLFVFFLLAWSLATALFEDRFPEWNAAQRWLAGVFTTSIFFLSVLLHELSHSLVAKRLGLPVSSITLFIFGGVSNLGREPERPQDEFRVAIVGPLTSFALAAFFAAIWGVTLNFSEPAAVISAYLAFINGVLGMFNMIPGFPLDGGRVLRSIVWLRNRNLLRATRIASMTGVVVAYLLVAVGIVVTFWVALISGIWLILIGWFLKNASEASYQQLLLRDVLQGTSILNLLNRDFVALPPDTTLRDLADHHILNRGRRYFPVLSEAYSLLGVITLSDLQKTPREQWENVTVYRAMTPAERLHVLTPRDDALRAFQLMAEHNIHQVPVLEGEQLIGFVTRADILQLIQTRSEIKG